MCEHGEAWSSSIKWIQSIGMERHELRVVGLFPGCKWSELSANGSPMVTVSCRLHH